MASLSTGFFSIQFFQTTFNAKRGSNRTIQNFQICPFLITIILSFVEAEQETPHLLNSEEHRTMTHGDPGARMLHSDSVSLAV